jgi:uncharacterized protein
MNKTSKTSIITKNKTSESTLKIINSAPSRNDVVTKEKLDKYFAITGEALKMASLAHKMIGKEEQALDFLDMASRYYEDAKYFEKKGDYVLAFAALNYAHGWLDAGARIKLFKVTDSRLFTVDDE